MRSFFPHTPFTGHESLIASCSQCFGKGNTAVVQVSLVSSSSHVINHMADSRTMVIQTSEQRCPRRAAPGAVIELSKAHAFAGETVNVRGFDFATVTAKIGKPHIVCDNHDEIWWRRLCG